MADLRTKPECYDPDGIEITSYALDFQRYSYLYLKYIAGSENLEFQSYSLNHNYYKIEFPEPLKNGEYRIVTQDADGVTYETTKTFSSAMVEQPVISSDTFSAYRDEAGDFNLKWTMPEGIDCSVDTSVTAYIYTDGKSDEIRHFIYTILPTDLNFFVISNNIFEEMTSLGNIFKIGVFLRSDDETFRAYSREVVLDENFSYTGQNAENDAVQLKNIPIANITIDGDSSDWTDITPQLLDAQGDSMEPSLAGSDLVSASVATNINKDILYFALQVVGETANANSDIVYLMYFDDPNVQSQGIRRDWQIGININNGFWIWDLREKDYDMINFSNYTWYDPS